MEGSVHHRPISLSSEKGLCVRWDALLVRFDDVSVIVSRPLGLMVLEREKCRGAGSGLEESAKGLWGIPGVSCIMVISESRGLDASRRRLRRWREWSSESDSESESMVPDWRAREWPTVDSDSAFEAAVDGRTIVAPWESDEVEEELGVDTKAGLDFLVMLRAVGLPIVAVLFSEPAGLSEDGLPMRGIWIRIGGAKCFCSI